MVVNAGDGVLELGECEGSLAEHGRGYIKLKLIEPVNKRMNVHLCVSHRQSRVHCEHTHKYRQKGATEHMQ